MASNILVLGAGELGTAMLSALAKRAPPTTTISVLLRPSTISSSSPSKVAELKFLSDLNIKFVAGDISTASTTELSLIFKPYDLIISCLGYASGPGSQTKITQAVLEAGVKRFVPWQFGADYDVIGRGSAQPVWDEQLDIRELLRAQTKTEWIIVSTGIFMSFLFEQFFGVVDIDEGVVRALGSWDTEVTVTTPEDIGRLTAEIVFVDEPRVANEVVYIAGQTISYGRLATLVDEVTGKKLRREVWNVQYLKDELRKDPENVVKRYRVVFAEGKGVAWDMARTFNKQREIKVTDVEAFAQEKLGSRVE